MTINSIIIAEQKNGSGFVKSAYSCNDEADFIARIAEVAARSGMDEKINTAVAALSYLDEKYAQRTSIITHADFDALSTDSWDTAVLQQAERLGWYVAPSDDDSE